VAEFIERRRTPRVLLRRPRAFEVIRTLQVQVVDVSAGGLLLLSPTPFPEGTRAQVRTVLGRPFRADVRIARSVGSDDRQSPVPLGVAFTAVDDESQLALAAFLEGPGI
jgi:hypothetical protein